MSQVKQNKVYLLLKCRSCLWGLCSLLPLTRTWFYSRICNICLVFIPISSINSLHGIFQKILCIPISLSANSQTKIENYYTHCNGNKISHLSQSWENCIVLHLQLETSSTNNGQLITFYNTAVKQWRLKQRNWNSKPWYQGRNALRHSCLPLTFTSWPYISVQNKRCSVFTIHNNLVLFLLLRELYP